MKIYQALLILVTILLSSHLIASEKGIDVIYGEDNRQDVFAAKDAHFIELSRSTAAMIKDSSLKSKSNEVTISGRTLSERGICASERFSNQITAASCSGFLVGENLLMTAGHCIKTVADCQSYKWVFDYKVDNVNQGKITVPQTNVYSCKKIISRALETISKDDYALIELDRKVTDRSPLNFRRSGKVSKGASLVVIGHPTGLPTKISDDAKVRSLQTKFFVANLDTYGGNSGSAVINTETSEVEGILVRGETDYIFDAAQNCQVSNRCAEGACRGEDVTYITNVPGLKKIR
ncbi:MAG TPA: trypsin-like peptidase domain-containing protein [Bacteriovoracaceae bacterium]|nr:trypsin-like peptidase domain-containing protein [Bacteriovoracaceae bacterium]